MMATSDSRTFDADTFEGFAFPLIVVKYCGPTNTRGSRYVATLARYEGMSGGSVRLARVARSFDYGPTPSHQALSVARECWAKYLPNDEGARVFVPADMADGHTGYVVVPAGMLEVAS